MHNVPELLGLPDVLLLLLFATATPTLASVQALFGIPSLMRFLDLLSILTVLGFQAVLDVPAVLGVHAVLDAQACVVFSNGGFSCCARCSMCEGV